MTQNTLNALLQKQTQIEARIKILKAKTQNQQRKDDTKRKILAGAYYLQKHQKEGTWAELVNALDPYLIRPKDRALFELSDKDNVTASKSG